MQNSNTPKVFVVIINHNGNNNLISCLDNVYASSYPNLEIVVVDNGSSDESFSLARKKFSRFHFIKNSEDVGFSKGVNMAIRFALEKMTEYVMILDCHTLISNKTIRLLVSDLSERENFGIASPTIFRAENSMLKFAGGKILWNKLGLAVFTEIESADSVVTEIPSEDALLIKNTVFKKVGLFDEKITSSSFACLDLSLRSATEGFATILVPSAASLSKNSPVDESFSAKKNLLLSKIVFFKKSSSGLQSMTIHLLLCWRKNIATIKSLFSSKNSSVDAEKEAFKKYKELSIKK